MSSLPLRVYAHAGWLDDFHKLFKDPSGPKVMSGGKYLSKQDWIARGGAPGKFGGTGEATKFEDPVLTGKMPKPPKLSNNFPNQGRVKNPNGCLNCIDPGDMVCAAQAAFCNATGGPDNWWIGLAAVGGVALVILLVYLWRKR